MLVFCEECGKRYSFPPEKVDPGSKKFRCRDCNFLMTIIPPDPERDDDCPLSPDPAVKNDAPADGG
ncbi:MAG: hypothetical protein BM485_14590 [Desulfobulbaceae bacterium DB1]|nr:MAG: hypothetical protein BM485_14590 [Desulfobulbaceae bacterium DB1]